jgi:hypothetical protein
MLQRILRILRRKDGGMEPFTAAFLLVVMLMLAFSLELWRLHAITTGVYDAMRSATVTTITENASTLYTAETDMAGDAYTYTGSGWQISMDTSAITDMLANHLGLRQSGSDWIGYDAGGHELYRLSGLTVQESNPLAPSGAPSTADKLTVTVTYTLKTVWQSGVILPVSVPMKVEAGIGGKF